MTKTIMFDLDGVLCDFIYGFTSLAANWFPVSPITSEQVDSWVLPFMHQDQLDRMWEAVNNDPRFWANLPLAPNVSPNDLGRISCLTKKHNVYFVTSRPEGVCVLQQTQDWLTTHGLERGSAVLSKRKAEFARLIQADYSIEDKWENAHCIHWLSDNPQTKSYLLDRKYNQISCAKIGARGVIRVNSLKEFLDAINRGD